MPRAVSNVPRLKRKKQIMKAARGAFGARSKLWKDTGFQGYEPPQVRTYQPKKKPPKGELTPEEKASVLKGINPWS